MLALVRLKSFSEPAQPEPPLPSYVTNRSEEVMWRLGFLEGHRCGMAEMKRAAAPQTGVMRRMLCILLTAARLVLLAVLVWCLVQAAITLGYRRAMIDMRQPPSMPSREGMAARLDTSADLNAAAPAVAPF